jgi:membrane protease YdiL (CAAX protease family)
MPPDRSIGSRSTPLGVLAVALVMASSLAGPVVGALFVFTWAGLTGTPMSAIGFVRPRRWMVTILGGIVLGIAFKLVMKAVVMPLLGAPPVNEAYRYLTGNAVALPGIVVTILVSAAFAEEVVYRGFLLERLRVLLGPGPVSMTVAVAISTMLFAAAHYADQGLFGSLQAVITGAVFAGLFLWRRELAFVMVVHAAFDLTAVALIFKGWEAPVARLVFR